ncbi:GIN domain-containing protein [Pedobacter sp. UC225_61]|uniref:GIN domain-containing protein n=1 Tax=Pedobacter sp. UC225_61 TaxID=3374623 RepID=UPI0037943BD9
MKTSIKTIFATGLIALATISSATVYAANPVNETSVSASAVKISSINKLKISGNVEVTIIQNSKSNVLYTNEGNEDVSVKKVGSSIYVSSKNKNQNGKITIYVDDIYRIEASENASVLANNLLTLKYLQVYVTDNAYVKLNAKTENLYTTITGSSKLDLKGSTDLYTINMDKSSKISLNRFQSKQTDMQSSVYVASRD